MRGRTTPGLWHFSRLLALAGFIAAPVVGDIGGCGQAPEDLDPYKFFVVKDRIDCQRCQDCGLLTEACARACALASQDQQFPAGCYPLAHDGEACLNALDAASCSEAESYMADEGATTPTECNFCPPDQEPTGESRAGEGAR